MKFLVDAQLPVRLARLLAEAGHDTVPAPRSSGPRHTSDLPDGNRTTDSRIAESADAQGRVVLTKDRDFRDGHLLRGTPQRLLVVTTGNITNNALLALFDANLAAIVAALEEAPFVECGPESLIIHRSDL